MKGRKGGKVMQGKGWYNKLVEGNLCVDRLVEGKG